MVTVATIGVLRVAAADRRLADVSWETFYTNDLGVVTYKHAGEAGTWFLKVAPPDVEPGLEAEAGRMRWAQQHLPVPEIVGTGRTESGGSWLLTQGLDGDDATRAQLRDEPRRLVTALALGLRRFHATAIEACPFSFRLSESLALAEARVRRGVVFPQRDFHPEHAGLSAEGALDQLVRADTGPEDLVVCHGDYCLPNALVEGDRVTGFVDLGELAVADRWWDLAIATWSITWNLGPGFEQVFLDAYGAELNLAKRDFYRLLYDVVS